MKRKLIIGSIGMIIAFIIFSLMIMYLRTKKFENLIYPGIYINKISVGGLSEEEAREKILKGALEGVANKKITLKAGEFICETNYEQLNIRFDMDSVLDNAVNYGKDLNFIEKHKLIYKPEKINFNIQLDFDEGIFNKLVDGLAKKVKKDSLDAKIEQSGGIFKITPEIIGKRLNVGNLERDLKEEINKNFQGDILIDGIIEKDVPKITEVELKSIDTKISSFSTSFYNSSTSRGNNIKVATQTINGTLLMPGDTFSFNKIVGKTTVEKGYESAKVIVGEEFVEDIGGGICQVSTTLYNAVLRSELTITERRNHSQPISYIPLGQDAMIFYGYSDLKFANNTDFPVFIEGRIENSTVSFNIYSNIDLSGKIYNMESKITKTLKPQINVIYDPSLTKGETILEKEGKPSYTVDVYRTTYIGDKVLKKELVSTSKYNGKNKVLRMGN